MRSGDVRSGKGGKPFGSQVPEADGNGLASAFRHQNEWRVQLQVTGKQRGDRFGCEPWLDMARSEINDSHERLAPGDGQGAEVPVMCEHNPILRDSEPQQICVIGCSHISF